MTKEKRNHLIIDLSKKSPKEIGEFLNALLSVRYDLINKGYKFKISKRKRLSAPPEKSGLQPTRSMVE